MWEIATLGLVGLAVWRASNRWRNAGGGHSQGWWRMAPLAASVAVLAVTFPTLGAGVLLAPVAAATTVLSARRLAAPRGLAFWIGATLSAALSVAFLAAVAIGISDAVTS